MTPVKTESAIGTAQKLAEEREQLQVAIDEQLMQCAADGSEPDWVTTQLAGALGWDRQKIARELGRVTEVHRWRLQAGGASAREAARAERDQAVAEQAEDLDDEVLIAGAQARIHARAVRRAAAEAKVGAFERACAMLRGDSLLPGFVVERLRDSHRRTVEEFGRLRSVESRLAVIDATIALPVTLDPNDGRRHHLESTLGDRALPVETLHAAKAALTTRTRTFPINNPRIGRGEVQSGGAPAARTEISADVSPEGWAAYLIAISREREQIEAEAEMLRPAHRAALAEVDQIREHYLIEDSSS